MYVAEYGGISKNVFKKYKQIIINAIKATYRDVMINISIKIKIMK